MFLAQRKAVLVHRSLLLELEIYVWFYTLIFHLTTKHCKHLSMKIQRVFTALAFRCPGHAYTAANTCTGLLLCMQCPILICSLSIWKGRETISGLLIIIQCKILYMYTWLNGGFPGGSVVKNSAANAGDAGDLGSSRVGKISWRRAWQPSSIVLPGKSQGWWSLVGYSPWGHKRVGHNWSDLVHSVGWIKYLQGK